ncbi:MAG TPA: hypothetical protein VFU98_16515, partial [Microlunatus sp.]|nr:hypothetical protein [Microlunatus sp.]
MGVPMKLATFGLALVVVLIAALEIGYRLRPAADAATSPSGSPSTGSAEHGGSEHGGSEHGGSEQGGTEPRSTAPSDTPTAESGQDVSGLAATVDGYTLTLLTPRPSAAERTTIRFLITGPDQQPVTAYDTAHGKQLHLIVVRRDLAGYRHVHPTMAPDGTWSVDLYLGGGG